LFSFLLSPGRDDFLLYEELADVIVAVAVAKPKKDVFVDRYCGSGREGSSFFLLSFFSNSLYFLSGR
jgi:hypothetical protein